MNNQEKKIIIEGPAILRGKIKVSGSKNAVLPILAATLISDKQCIVRNVPDLSDISTMISMLEILGKKVYRSGTIVTVEPAGKLYGKAPYDLVKKMRASILVMGALACRLDKLSIPLPGGCAIGSRPVDLHLKGMQKLGAKFKVSEGYVNLSAKGLKGAVIYLDYPSVGATENLIMAACAAEGETIIENAAQEPEIQQLIDFLKAMGAHIVSLGNTIKIEGQRDFHSLDYTVMDDRIQAGTYLLAGCIKHSKLEVQFSHPEELEALVDKISACGANISIEGSVIKVEAPLHLSSTEIKTSPHPGFATDLQAPFMSLMTLAKGVSVLSEDVFENRFLHCAELQRMGANIEIKGGSAIVTGSKYLSGAPVTAMDLRGGAALIVAGLMAKGRTEISGLEHIERGYERIVDNLSSLGAKIWMQED